MHADDPHYQGLDKQQRRLLSATSTQQVAAWHSGDRSKAETQSGASAGVGKIRGFGIARSAVALRRGRSSARLSSSGRLNLRSSHADHDGRGAGTGEGSSAPRVGVFTLGLRMLGFKPKVLPHRAG